MKSRILVVAVVLMAIVGGTVGLSFADESDNSYLYPNGIRYYTAA